MKQQDVVLMIQEMEIIKIKLDALKGNKDYDGRSIAIAITNLETAMLWFANAPIDLHLVEPRTAAGSLD